MSNCNHFACSGLQQIEMFSSKRLCYPDKVSDNQVGSSSISSKLNLTSRWLIRGCQPSEVPVKSFLAVPEMAAKLEPSPLGAEAVRGRAALPCECCSCRSCVSHAAGCSGRRDSADAALRLRLGCGHGPGLRAREDGAVPSSGGCVTFPSGSIPMVFLTSA